MGRRVLQCITSMDGGGAERQLTYLCRGLVGLGWDVHAAFIRQGPNGGHLAASGAQVHHLGPESHRNPVVTWRLLRLFRRLEPDLAQTWIPMMDVAGGACCLALGTPWVLSERSAERNYLPNLTTRARYLLGKRASAVVSNSRSGDEIWEKRARPVTIRAVIPNALPLDEIGLAKPGLPEGWPVPEDAKLLVFAGRLDREKDLPTLVEALALALPKTGAWAAICGEGPESASVRRMLREKGIEGRCHVAGYVEGLWSLLKRADLLVSTSLWEGMPNVLMEAAACKCPVVASRIPENLAILDDECAFLAPPGDPEAFASSIATVLESPDLARERASVACERAAGWTIESAARRYSELYEALLARGAA